MDHPHHDIAVPDAITPLFSAMTDPVALIGDDGRLLWWNTAFAALCGLATRPSRAIRFAELFEGACPHATPQGADGVPVAALRRCCGGPAQVEVVGWPMLGRDGRALCHARILRDVTERTRLQVMLGRLYDVSSSQHLTGPEKIGAILSLGCGYLGLDIGMVNMIDDQTLTVLFAHGGTPNLVPGARFALARTFCDDTHRAGAPRAYHDAARDDHPAWRTYRMAAYLGAPLVVDGNTVGTLGFCDGAPRRPFSDEEIGALRLFAAWIAQEINLEQTRRSLTEAALRDALTGAATRQAFDPALKAACRRAPGAEAAALVLMDVDRFKAVNDRHGHATGDAVLRGVAATIARHLPDDTVLYRIGGEEFALILPETAAEDARVLAEIIREAVDRGTHGTSARDLLPVTVSIGIARHAGPHESPEAWFRRADASLYAAKDAGRNRVMQAERRTGATIALPR